MDLQTNVYRIETLHQFDLEDANELLKLLKIELKLLEEERIQPLLPASEEKIKGRINWLTRMISVLESGLTSRIEIVKKLEEKCRQAPELLNDSEMKVFLASVNTKKTNQEIADEVGYDEGYVRVLRYQIRQKLGIRIVKI